MGMKKKIKNGLIFIIALLALLYLAQTIYIKKQDIWVGWTLEVHQSYQENIRLRYLMSKVLNKESEYLPEIINFDCGGGAGCYDLGFVITQIIYRVGEDEFITMMSVLTIEDKFLLESLIRVGLAYGDNDRDGMMDNWDINTEFPKLVQIFSANKQAYKNKNPNTSNQN